MVTSGFAVVLEVYSLGYKPEIIATFPLKLTLVKATKCVETSSRIVLLGYFYLKNCTSNKYRDTIKSFFS